ncbi:MAG: hypothetical protein R3F02_00910 [Thiolinea sp.]
MKITPVITISIAMLSLSLFSQAGFAGVSEEREARTKKIEALYFIIRDSRIERSKRVQAKLDLARLQAEIRKERRTQ